MKRVRGIRGARPRVVRGRVSVHARSMKSLTALVLLLAACGGAGFDAQDASKPTGALAPLPAWAAGAGGGVAPSRTLRSHDEPGRFESRTIGERAAAPARTALGHSGRRIDLDVKEADVADVCRLLADVGKVNIVVADDVQAKVTVRMRQVPWDQALDVILRTKGYRAEREGNVITVLAK